MRPDGDDDGRGAEFVPFAVVPDLDRAAARDPALAAVDDGPGLLERRDVALVVGFGGIGGAVDHVVAPRRRPRPRVLARILVVLVGAVEQGLRRDAADVRATAAEPALVHDRDRRAELASLVGGGLAGRARPR